MKQKITPNEAQLIAVGNSVADGIDEIGATLNMDPALAETLRNQSNTVIAGRTAVQLSTAELRTRQATLRAVMALCRAFATLAREILKPHMGTRYNEGWNIAGFVTRLAMPRTAAKMLLLLNSLKTYFTNNAGRENIPLNVTAAQAEALIGQLQAAITALNVHQASMGSLRSTRSESRDALRLNLWSVVAFLNTKLGVLDDRWLTFGLNKPGAQEVPDVPTGLAMTLAGANAVSVKWLAAARAEQYRIWKRVVGEDDELASFALVGDLDFTIEGLPSNATVEIAVSALNNGGESARSPVLTVQTA